MWQILALRPPQTQFLTCPPAGGDVTVINGATESTSTVAIQPPRSAIDPVAIALNETSPTAYVVAQGWGVNIAKDQGCLQDFYAVLAIDTSTLIPRRFILGLYSEGFYLSGIAVNRSTGSIYVGYFAGPSTNIIVITGNGYSYLPVSAGPIAINETTNKIYVAGSNGIAVIDGATNSVATTFPTLVQWSLRPSR
jgi:DNA-binding beta-propeller fold protein YncE